MGDEGLAKELNGGCLSGRSFAGEEGLWVSL